MKRLQLFGFKNSEYARPNQNWVCGWASEGKSCRQGPDHKGCCRATFECVPRKEGSSWVCCRNEAAGGKCENGPLPDGTCCNPIPKCQPVRSLRAKRGLAAVWTTVMAFGLVVYFSSGSTGDAFISPGELGFNHGVVVEGCSGCHVAGQNGSIGWLTAAFKDTGKADSELCLGCHNLGEHNINVHSQPPSRIEEISKRVAAMPAPNAPLLHTVARMLPGVEQGASAELGCAVCHYEHRGHDSDLKAMDNDRCQSCHTNPFHALNNGHPEFRQYPYKRRTRISFDHVSHIGKHFDDEDLKQFAPKECSACHQPDGAGRAMLTAGFDQTCAGCHEEQIRGEGRPEKAIAFFSLPGIDAESLKAAGINIGEWPEDADGQLTLFMQLLLSADSQFSADWKTLDGQDLFDLSDAEPQVLKAAGHLAWEIKQLLYEFTMSGQTAMQSRFQKAFAAELSAAELTQLSGQIPIELVAMLQKEWLPNLIKEVSSRAEASDAANEDVPTVATAEGQGTDGDYEEEEEEDSYDEAEPEPPVDLVASGGWFSEYFTLYYRPAGHEDRFLKAWLDFTAAESAAKKGAPAEKIFAMFSDQKAIGLCGKCHSIDAVSNDRLHINWRGYRRDPMARAFTKFNHTTHFSLLDTNGCLTCHSLDKEAEYQKHFEQRDSGVFASNFSPMEKSNCVSCHVPKAAGDDCLKCHNYHIGKFPATVTNAKFAVQTTTSSPVDEITEDNPEDISENDDEPAESSLPS